MGGCFWTGSTVKVNNGEEQREAILITSAAAPAISTYETDRAKHQLMQQYPHRAPVSREDWPARRP